MVDITIMYEHKAREMDSICLIRAEMERRGYSVAFRHASGMGEHRVVPSRVVVVPYLYRNTDLCNIRRFLQHTQKVVNLQWEQLFTMDDENNATRIPRNEAKNAVHVCWSESTRSRLMDGGISSRNAVNTGPIHMDFLRPEFTGYYLSRKDIAAKYALDTGRKWCLFISSYSDRVPKSKIDVYRKQGRQSAGERLVFAHESKRITLDWIEVLLRQRDSIIFIYRPHPSEHRDPRIERLEREYKNFRRIDDLSVKQWCLVCDKVLTWMSTSIVEAYFANSDCSIIRPVDIPVKLDMRIYLNAKMISSLEGFLDCIDDASGFPIAREVIEEYYGLDKDVPSYKRLCDLLDRVLHDDSACVDCNVVAETPLPGPVKDFFIHTMFHDAYVNALVLFGKTTEILKIPLVGSLRRAVNKSRVRKRDYINPKESMILVERIKDIIGR